MSRLEISNLSFCEVATDEDIEVTGGLSFAENIRSQVLSTVNKVFTSTSENFSRQQVYSGSDFVVEKLNNPTTGVSGFAVSSKDGTSQSVVLSGGNTSTFGKVSLSSSLTEQTS